MRVNLESFEEWYANQIKYHKITDEEPGRRLKEWSYSISEIAEMLELSDGVVYDLIKRNNIEVIIVDYWKRVPKEAFQKWYQGQSRYRTKDDKKRDAEMESATITMPEMAMQLGVSRQQVYGILNNKKYRHFFEFVIIADRKRITKESFQQFLNGQDEYHLDPANDYKELAMEDNIALADYRRKKLAETGDRSRNGNLNYLTSDEAAFLAKVSRSMITAWYSKEQFPIVKVGSQIRIKRKEFEEWLEQRNRERGCYNHGISQRTKWKI